MTQVQVPPQAERRPMSWAEWSALGETSWAEYYDGEYRVNPPTRRHVRIGQRLSVALDPVVPQGYEVLPEAGWAVGPRDTLTPDLMVARVDAPGEDVLRETPLLVVEILSPSTRATDLGRKLELYGQAGLADYWVLDPDDDSFHTYRLLGGQLRLQDVLAATRAVPVDRPFAVTLDLPALFA